MRLCLQDAFFFEDSALPPAGAIIFLDVDGTLVPDGATDVTDQVFKKINILRSRCHVYLTTNARNQKRRQWLADTFDIPLIGGDRKKPSRAVLTGIDIHGKILVVIGDRYVTDEIFAWRIGAQFIRVKRKQSGQERLFVRLLHVIDDVCSAVSHLFLFSICKKHSHLS